MEHLTNVHEDCLSQHENSYKLCDEMGHPVLNLKESPWKMRQQHEQNSQWGGESHCRTNAGIWRKKSKWAGLLDSQ